MSEDREIIWKGPTRLIKIPALLRVETDQRYSVPAHIADNLISAGNAVAAPEKKTKKDSEG